LPPLPRSYAVLRLQRGEVGGGRQQIVGAEIGDDYGFAPEREGSNPLGMTARTTTKGLWLASAYVFGGGFTGAMIGGAAAARDR
jgi:phytoene dehydrogenase-like protein